MTSQCHQKESVNVPLGVKKHNQENTKLVKTITLSDSRNKTKHSILSKIRHDTHLKLDKNPIKIMCVINTIFPIKLQISRQPSILPPQFSTKIESQSWIIFHLCALTTYNLTSKMRKKDKRIYIWYQNQMMLV